MTALTELKRTARGLAVITDWLGHGGNPVAQEQAESRSQVCLTGEEGKPCRHNKASGWWDTAKGSIAQGIRDILEVKNKARIRVPEEDQLGMCGKCGCCLRLKVWTPLEHIRRNLDTKTVAEMPSFCWVRKELTDGHS